VAMKSSLTRERLLWSCETCGKRIRGKEKKVNCERPLTRAGKRAEYARREGSSGFP